MEIFILSIAVWRITHMVYEEKIFEVVRFRLQAEIAEGVYTYPDTFIGNLFSCFWCISVWVSFVCTIMLLLYKPLLYPFVASAITMWVQTLWHMLVPEP